ncbi:MAG TPA: YihY family inner membrane protein [Rhodanobacteraceae bacterium]|nr:YihY family inner membrane protein [Rhodanobacteraceae bacterium]
MSRYSALREVLRRDRLEAFGSFLWRRFRDDKCFETAGALSYTTLFAIVPLLTAVVAVLAAVPVFAGLREHVSDFIFRNFVPASGETVQGYLLQFADNASKLTIVGILFLLVSALMMLASIEDRFNRIWRVPSPRKGSARFLLYWAALTLGPLALVAAVAASYWVFAQPALKSAGETGVFGLQAVAALPFLVTWIGLTVLYQLVPNCRVRWRDAAAGALIGALLFEAARHGFAWYVQTFANYRAVYGALAAIPIFLIWVYMSWVIVLLGATLTAALAAFEYHDPREMLPPGCEFVGLLRVLQHFTIAQRAGVGLQGSELSKSEGFLTNDLLQRYLEDLRRAGVIRRTDTGEWVMARDLDSVRVDDLLRAGGYRLPTDALALQRAAAGLAPEARVILQRAEAALRENLAVPLRTLFSGSSFAGTTTSEEKSS